VRKGCLKGYVNVCKTLSTEGTYLQKEKKDIRGKRKGTQVRVEVEQFLFCLSNYARVKKRTAREKTDASFLKPRAFYTRVDNHIGFLRKSGKEDVSSGGRAKAVSRRSSLLDIKRKNA